MTAELIKALGRRRRSMDVEYQMWEPHFRELRDAIKPTKGRFFLGESRKSSTINKKVVDTTASQSHQTLKSGLMGGVTSPSRPWFKLGIHGQDDIDDPDVKAYLHTCQSRMYQVLRGSNMYGTLDKCYGDLGLYGTFGGLIRGSFENVIHSHAFPMGLYRIAEDSEGVINALHWDLNMTVEQCVEQFGEDRVSNSVRNRYNSNDRHTNVAVCAAVELRKKRDPNSPLSTNKPVAVYYWEKNESAKMLDVSGLGVNGMLGPRWEASEGETWSVTSPAMEALGDAVQLQVQHRDKAIAIQTMIKPPMQGPAGSKRTYSGNPASFTTVTTMNIEKGGARPAHVPNVDISHLREDIFETQQRIKASFITDLFRMTSEMGIEGVKDVTATAIASMHEEKLLVLGPVLESLNNGLLQPVIESTFHYMQEAQILPEAPDALDGSPVKVEFIGLLAQAQKAIGLAAIERTIGFVGSVAQLKPEVLDKLDVDETVDAFADQVGPPPSMIRTTKQANESRKARAEAEQQQGMIEAAEPLAHAASLISEASDRGAAGLEEAGL